jgi:hypothetical protein
MVLDRLITQRHHFSLSSKSGEIQKVQKHRDLHLLPLQPPDTMTKGDVQVFHSEEKLRDPFEVLSLTLSFQHEDHRLWWEQGGFSTADYLRRTIRKKLVAV